MHEGFYYPESESGISHFLSVHYAQYIQQKTKIDKQMQTTVYCKE